MKPHPSNKAFKDYGFDFKIESAIAERKGYEFYSLLFRDGNGSLFAVTFNGYGDNPEDWRIADDCVEFDSVEEFQKIKLVRTL